MFSQEIKKHHNEKVNGRVKSQNESSCQMHKKGHIFMRFKRMVALQNERRQSIENKVIIQNKSHLINTVCVRRRSFIS